MTNSSLDTQLIRFGHSPDPDDAFMFYAFAYETIPMRGFKVQHVIEDIESLNQRALKNAELEVTAVSCHAYAFLADKYKVMRSGCSMGDHYGPILVSKKGKAESGSIKGKRIGVPGKLTTAYLALQIYEKDFTPVFIPFDKIFDAVESGEVDFGLIIHEGQITFEKKGFEKFLDLGKWWYEKHSLPLPLGVDVIRRDLGEGTMKSFSALFKESILYSLNNRKPALEYAKQYGRGISDELNDQFVGMYVNDWTVDLGEKGIRSFQTLLDEAHQKGLIPRSVKLEFV